MSCCELSLVCSVCVKGFSNLLIHLEFIWNLKLNKELRSVSNSFQVLRSEKNPKQNVVNCSLVSLLNFSLHIMHKSKDCQETINSFCMFWWSFIREISFLLRIIKFSYNCIEELDQFKSTMIIAYGVLSSKSTRERFILNGSWFSPSTICLISLVSEI